MQDCGEKPMFHLQSQWSPETHLLPVRSTWETLALDVQILPWEIVWRSAPRIWLDFGSALPFQTRLGETKPVLPLSNEHGSQVKDHGWWQCCHNKHKKFPYQPTCDGSLLSGQVSYNNFLFWWKYCCVMMVFCYVYQTVPSASSVHSLVDQSLAVTKVVWYRCGDPLTGKESRRLPHQNVPGRISLQITAHKHIYYLFVHFPAITTHCGCILTAQ